MRDRNLEHDVEHCTAAQLQERYGIEFFEDPDSKSGQVYDSVSRKTYVSLSEWVTGQVEEESWADNDPQLAGKYYDEDY